jgi:hypothetical protein
MKSLLATLQRLLLAAFVLLPLTGRADSQMSVQNLQKLQDWGLFTPAFQAAVHELVDTKDGIVEANKETADLTKQLPDLQQQATAEQAKVALLKTQLVQYDHGDESDFAQLQKTMSDPAAKPEDQLPIVQAYVWAYPFSPHETVAQHELEKLRKLLADQAQAQKDAAAALEAAHAKLLQRVHARDLSLAEWRDFLYGLSETDVLKYLGPSDAQDVESWMYYGNWTEDPTTHEKVGLQVTFEGGRVLTVMGTTPPSVQKAPETQ